MRQVHFSKYDVGFKFRLLSKLASWDGIFSLSCTVRTSSLCYVGTSLKQLALVCWVVKWVSNLSPWTCLVIGFWYSSTKCLGMRHLMVFWSWQPHLWQIWELSFWVLSPLLLPFVCHVILSALDLFPLKFFLNLFPPKLIIILNIEMNFKHRWCAHEMHLMIFLLRVHHVSKLGVNHILNKNIWCICGDDIAIAIICLLGEM